MNTLKLIFYLITLIIDIELSMIFLKRKNQSFLIDSIYQSSNYSNRLLIGAITVAIYNFSPN